MDRFPLFKFQNMLRRRVTNMWLKILILIIMGIAAILFINYLDVIGKLSNVYLIAIVLLVMVFTSLIKIKR
ncbi:hypothetical protein DDR33_19230 [Pararcticibacter amylolyticus]|uniref:Uncharacterized protein n=1 Tax=Pararcticibacter amylolyticus TaxID=2173175 RepID=A0A2U2PCE9_9SPHI|nr:hypothetical protein DDR33_19230 [Pararcticibacter amylolyticus]